MLRILFNFKQLIDVKNIVLTSHALPNSIIPNNQELIDNLEARIYKLQQTAGDGKPYQSLYGDICKIQEDLGVILRNYQARIKKHEIQSNNEHNVLGILVSNISTGKKPILNEKDSNLLALHTRNTMKVYTMKNDIPTIANIHLKSYLADHTDKPGFPYI